jgi:hypothetical protein
MNLTPRQTQLGRALFVEGILGKNLSEHLGVSRNSREEIYLSADTRLPIDNETTSDTIRGWLACL